MEIPAVKKSKIGHIALNVVLPLILAAVLLIGGLFAGRYLWPETTSVQLLGSTEVSISISPKGALHIYNWKENRLQIINDTLVTQIFNLQASKIHYQLNNKLETKP